MKKLKLLFNRQDGATVAIVAISMVVLLGFSALVVDGGALYLEKSRVQKSVDAAVLAGAQVLPAKENAANIAMAVAAENGVTLDRADILVTESSIEVKAQTETDLTFAQVFGFSTANVAAVARAEKGGTIVGGSGFLPLVVLDEVYIPGQQVELTSPPGSGETGNYGYIRFAEGNLAENIKNGYKGHLEAGMKVSTEPGNNTSSIHVRNAINDRIDSDKGKPKCQSHLTVDSSCKKLIFIPMVDTLSVPGSSQKVTIEGFAAFLLTDDRIRSSNNSIIRGIFVEDQIFPGDVSTTAIKSYGLTSVKLVN
jgi:Flp pilus assembly protein TadG